MAINNDNNVHILSAGLLDSLLLWGCPCFVLQFLDLDVSTWSYRILWTFPQIITFTTFTSRSWLILSLWGRGCSGEVDFHFFVVSYRGEWQLPGTFFRMKNIVPSQTYRILKNSLVINNLFKPQPELLISNKSVFGLVIVSNFWKLLTFWQKL